MRLANRRKQLYLLSRIVKEQPIGDSARKHHSSAHARLNAVSSAWVFAGGANRDRTDDLLLAKQALSQLSYGPNDFPSISLAAGPALVGGSGWIRTIDPRLIKTVL